MKFKLNWKHIHLAVICFIPTYITWFTIPVILGNGPKNEIIDKILIPYYFPSSILLGAFLIYFAFFTKFYNPFKTERSEGGEATNPT